MMLIELPKVIGHRGARDYAPENTLASMKMAHELGVKWVEFDVMLAKCKTPIIMHDHTLDRTTNGHGEVSQFSYQEIKHLDAGGWYATEYRGERVPRFIDMINCLAEYHLAANVEIKPYPQQDVETASAVLETIEKNWPNVLPRPLVSSFSLESLRTVRQKNKTILLGLLLDQQRKEWREICDELNCVSVHLSREIATKAFINEIKKTNRKVLVFTVNEMKEAKKLWEWGVDSVFSDAPDKLL